jgi:hypothetical protein
MSDEDIQNNLEKFEKFKDGNSEKVLLYHQLKIENLKIIRDKINYLDLDTAKIPIIDWFVINAICL